MKEVVTVRAGNMELEGFLNIPRGAQGLILFAHGSGSSRHSPRNKRVADYFNSAGLGTLLFDLLTKEEERVDMMTRELRFDIDMLAERVAGAIDWLQDNDFGSNSNIGLIGSSTGAAAALIAAAKRPHHVKALVSRGGRPDLADKFLPLVKAPVLLVVGSLDFQVIELNEKALEELRCVKKIELVAGATHLFEERGTLEKAAFLAREWFLKYLSSA